jgi:hypothetical protein
LPSGTQTWRDPFQFAVTPFRFPESSHKKTQKTQENDVQAIAHLRFLRFHAVQLDRHCVWAGGSIMAVAMVMRGMLVLLGLFRGYMPAAIVTGGGFFITGIAQERASLEILLQPGLIVCR